MRIPKFKWPKAVFIAFGHFFAWQIKQMKHLSFFVPFYEIYAILYKKPTAELGQTFRGDFRPSLTGRRFF